MFLRQRHQIQNVWKPPDAKFRDFSMIPHRVATLLPTCIRAESEFEKFDPVDVAIGFGIFENP